MIPRNNDPLEWLFGPNTRGPNWDQFDETCLNLQQHMRRTVGAANRDFMTVISALAEQNRQLRVRVGVLVRMLVERGQFTSEEFAAQVQALDVAIAAPTPPTPKPASLPKPPKRLKSAKAPTKPTDPASGGNQPAA